MTPLGEVELLSTHDQLLGGPSGQSYLGCRFPADFAYAARDHRGGREDRRAARARGRARPLRRRLRRRRATPRGDWTPYAIELNLRKGGTTHPFLTLQFLTDGALRPGHGAVHRPERPREAPRRDRPPRVASCCAGSPIDDLFDIVVRHRLHFDQARQTGVVFHMMSALSELGRIGLTAVGDSPSRPTRPTGGPSASWSRRPSRRASRVCPRSDARSRWGPRTPAAARPRPSPARRPAARTPSRSAASRRR